MSKSESATPAVPDPTTTAAAQTQSNLQTAAGQTALNDVNQNTPYGSVTYNQTGTANGVPTYTEDTSLSPAGQQLFDSEGSLENSALNAAGGLASGISTTPINTNTADSSVLDQSPQALDSAAANAVYNQEESYLQPQLQQTQTQLQDQLSRQGIPLGSQAYNNSETQYNNTANQANQSAADSAIEQGISAGSSMNQQALADQQQNINQQIQTQDQPVNLLSALISGSQATGQTTAPSSTPASTQISPTNVAGITQNSYSDALSNYQAQLAQQNSLFGGLASLGGNLGAAAILAP